MKKTMKFMAMLLCAAMVCGLASCNREEDGGEDGNLSSGEWVDLGLPSGLLWASCNIGASSQEEFGNYYAWGMTHEEYGSSNYPWFIDDSHGYVDTVLKYNNNENYGPVDNRTTLEPSDDVATVLLGGGARIPTISEWQELEDYTYWQYTTMNNVRGAKFTSIKNGHSIFLPAAGIFIDTVHYDEGKGWYWSSTLTTDYVPTQAECYDFYPKNIAENHFTDHRNTNDVARSYRLSVRAVRPSHN